MKCRRRKALTFLLLCSGMANAVEPADAPLPTLVMATFATPGRSSPRSLNALIYAEAFRRLGYRLVVVPLPPLRATRMAEAGLIDGELERSTAYGATHPGLVRIDQVSQILTLGAYVVDPGIRIERTDAFVKSPYRFEYRMGIRAAQAGVPGGIPESQISVIGSTEQGLRKLAAGRTDVYIDFDERVNLTMRLQPALQGGHIFRAGTLQEVRINAYLSRKRAALAPVLAAELDTMKREGVIAGYERAINGDAQRVVAGK